MKFSVITVCKNAADNLEPTIKSVLSQTEADFEYLIIDGASADDTGKILKKYRPKIDYLLNEPDRGIYDAMNKGVLKAKGDWLFFLNAGDTFFDSRVLKNITETLASNDLVYGNVYMGTSDGGYLNKFGKINRWFLLQSTVCHQSLFARRDLFTKWGLFALQYKIAADYDWLLRMILVHDAKVNYADINISRMDMTGISNNPKYRNIVLGEYAQIRQNYFSSMEIIFLDIFEKTQTLLVSVKATLGL